MKLHKKGFNLNSVLPIAIVFVITGLAIAIGLNVMNDVKDDFVELTTDTYYNTTDYGALGFNMWLRMDANETKNKTSDYTGVNNGTGHNGTLWVSSAKVSGGFYFDGVDNWINVRTPLLLAGQNGTILFWAKPVSNGQINTFMSDGNGTNFRINHQNNNLRLGDYTNNNTGDGSITVNNTLTNNSWNFIAVARNDDELRIYVDAVLVFNMSLVGALSPFGNIDIGRFNPGANQYKGYLDEIRTYQRVLSPAEIMRIYSATNVLYNSTYYIDRNVYGNDYNASVDAVGAVSKFPAKLGILATVLIMALLVGILVKYFSGMGR